MQNDCNRIPGDVVLEIMGHLRPLMNHVSGRQVLDSVRRGTLSNLALACREYHQYALPFLFEVIHMDESRYPPHSLRFCVRFCRSVLHGNERARSLAGLVRTYIIQAPGPPKEAANPDCIVSCKVVPFFPNLRELHAIYLPITNDFLSAVTSLPLPLQVLRTEECAVPGPLDEAVLKKFSALQVLHVYYSPPPEIEENEHSLHFARHYPLSRAKRLTGVSQTNVQFLRGLATSHLPMGHLEHMKFTTVECDKASYLLADLLKKAPALRTLYIAGFQYEMDAPPLELGLIPYVQYPKLPYLQHIHAPLPALRALIPGSAVSSIGIAREETYPAMRKSAYGEKGPTFWEPYTDAFSKSLKPILSMDVPLDFYTSVHFARHFPSLKTLNIRPKHWNWRSNIPSTGEETDEVIALFLDAWDSHPNLNELQFFYVSLSLELPTPHVESADGRMIPITVPCGVSENTLQNLRRMIPSLKSVKFWDQQLPCHCNHGYEFSLR